MSGGKGVFVSRNESIIGSRIRGRGRGGHGASRKKTASSRSSDSSLSASSDKGENLDEEPSIHASKLGQVEDYGVEDIVASSRAASLEDTSAAIDPEFYPPQSRLSGKFPGSKNLGRLCKLQTNHFPLSLRFPEGIIHQYSVTIIPPWFGKREYRRSDKQLYHDVIKAWKEVCPAAKHNTAAWVFDGHKQLFCTKAYRIEELPDQKVSVWCEEEERIIDVMVREGDGVH